MKKLLQQIVENGSFLLMCVGVAAALILIAKLAERRFRNMHKVSPARRVSIIGICSAMATVLHMLDFPLVFMAPDFYKLDFSELPVMLCGFYLGPSAAIVCEGLKILLKLMLQGTSTAFVGDFANFAVGCSMVLPAIIVYPLRKSRGSAILGLCIGTVVLTVFGTAFNAVYLLPTFARLYGVELETLIGYGTAIHRSVDDVVSFVILCVAPLNLLKGILISVLTMLLYKRVARRVFGK